jgi:hypothetical protein
MFNKAICSLIFFVFLYLGLFSLIQESKKVDLKLSEHKQKKASVIKNTCPDKMSLSVSGTNLFDVNLQNIVSKNMGSYKK